MEKDLPAAEILQSIADGWLAYQRATGVDAQGAVVARASDELFEFVLKVDDLVGREPEVAWLVIPLTLADASRSTGRN